MVRCHERQTRDVLLLGTDLLGGFFEDWFHFELHVSINRILPRGQAKDGNEGYQVELQGMERKDIFKKA